MRPRPAPPLGTLPAEPPLRIGGKRWPRSARFAPTPVPRAAIRLVLERVCGRTPEAAAEGAALDVALPALRTAAACAAAVDKIAAAVTAGTIDDGKAKLLIDVVQARMKSIEVNDLEQRLAELEKQASTVDFGSRR